MERDELVRHEIACAAAWGLIEDGRRALASLFPGNDHHVAEADHARACREAAQKRAAELATQEQPTEELLQEQAAEG